MVSVLLCSLILYSKFTKVKKVQNVASYIDKEHFLVLQMKNITYLFYFILQVQANFTAVYHNFTSLVNLEVCIKYNILSFSNLQVIKSLFEGITCGNLTPIIKISENLHVLKKHSTCPYATELHNLTSSDVISYTQYCGNIFFLHRCLMY